MKVKKVHFDNCSVDDVLTGVRVTTDTGLEIEGEIQFSHRLGEPAFFPNMDLSLDMPMDDEAEIHSVVLDKWNYDFSEN